MEAIAGYPQHYKTINQDRGLLILLSLENYRVETVEWPINLLCNTASQLRLKDFS